MKRNYHNLLIEDFSRLYLSSSTNKDITRSSNLLPLSQYIHQMQQFLDELYHSLFYELVGNHEAQISICKLIQYAEKDLYDRLKLKTIIPQNTTYEKRLEESSRIIEHLENRSNSRSILMRFLTLFSHIFPDIFNDMDVDDTKTHNMLMRAIQLHPFSYEERVFPFSYESFLGKMSLNDLQANTVSDCIKCKVEPKSTEMENQVNQPPPYINVRQYKYENETCAIFKGFGRAKIWEIQGPAGDTISPQKNVDKEEEQENVIPVIARHCEGNIFLPTLGKQFIVCVPEKIERIRTRIITGKDEFVDSGFDFPIEYELLSEEREDERFGGGYLYRFTRMVNLVNSDLKCVLFCELTNKKYVGFVYYQKFHIQDGSLRNVKGMLYRGEFTVFPNGQVTDLERWSKRKRKINVGRKNGKDLKIRCFGWRNRNKNNRNIENRWSLARKKKILDDDDDSNRSHPFKKYMGRRLVNIEV